MWCRAGWWGCLQPFSPHSGFLLSCSSLLIAKQSLLAEWARHQRHQPLPFTMSHLAPAERDKNQGWASVLFKRTFRSFRSFTFFSKERSVLSVLLRSFQKNVPFFPFFSVLLKRTERSFLRSFWFHKSY